MKFFNFHQPTQVRFGEGRLDEVGEVVGNYGQRCLLVTGHTSKAKLPIYEKVKTQLRKKGISVFHFDGVITNPTTDIAEEGARLAVEHNVDVVLGLGGGSSMDTAKAIAVGATHSGKVWDYRLFGEKKISNKTLPVIAVPTTSGTGSQVTPVAVITNPAEKFKSALVSPFLCPRACVVDPQLMLTVPERVTASTGFDAFAHAFESYIHKNASPYTDLLAVEAMRIIAKYLPIVVNDGSNKEARAWAMAIGGHAPNVLHGEALAAIYPEFMRYTYDSSVKKFATLGRILNPELEGIPDELAASKSCEETEKFLQKINMWFGLKQLNVPEDELASIAADSVKLPDYKVNPRVATVDEIVEILTRSYAR